jgi:hypothetical protein
MSRNLIAKEDSIDSIQNIVLCTSQKEVNHDQKANPARENQKD